MLNLLFLILPILASPKISYETTKHRLGDQLLSFSRALYISHKYNLDLVVKPFNYYEHLELSNLPHSNIKDEILLEKETVKNPDFIKKLDQNKIYLIPYFAESEIENDRIFQVDWQDKNFKKILKKYISPKSNLNIINPPKDKISIAIQIRKSSGPDMHPLLDEHTKNKIKFKPGMRYNDVVFPWKFPPNEYYINCLKIILDHFKNQDFYIFIFTDYSSPQKLIDIFKKKIKVPNIIWDFRKEKNLDTKLVLDDLFSIPNFDVLIRPDSNLGIISERISDHQISINPAGHKWINNRLIIDKLSIINNL